MKNVWLATLSRSNPDRQCVGPTAQKKPVRPGSISYSYEKRDRYEDHSDRDKYIHVGTEIGDHTERDPRDEGHDGLLPFPIEKKSKPD